MAQKLAELYSPELIKKLALAIGQLHPFDAEGFYQKIFAMDWPNKGLKQRIQHVAVCLHAFLPADYAHSLQILTAVAPPFKNFNYLFFCDFVERYGLDDFEASMQALAVFTQYASAEFAIRAFIRLDEARTMQQLFQWSQSDNHHLRRLSSEACRPRLPWASQLQRFRRNPQPILPILTQLKNDPSRYVQKSVANNLNDISKDHLQWVVDLAQQWHGQTPITDWIVRHACRTLLKQAEPQTRALLGFSI